jgi:hypothetical protein
MHRADAKFHRHTAKADEHNGEDAFTSVFETIAKRKKAWTVAELAEVLNCSADKLYRMVDDGRIPYQLQRFLATLPAPGNSVSTVQRVAPIMSVQPGNDPLNGPPARSSVMRKQPTLHS